MADPHMISRCNSGAVLEHLASKYAAWAASDKKLRHEIGYARARQLEDAARTRLDEIIECVIEAPAVTLQDFRTKLRVIKWCRAAEEINFPEWETADERVAFAVLRDIERLVD